MAGEVEVGGPAAAGEAPGGGEGAAAPLGSPAQELQAAGQAAGQAVAAARSGSSSNSTVAGCSPVAAEEPPPGLALAEGSSSPGDSSADVQQQVGPDHGERADKAIVPEASEGLCELQLLLSEDGTVTARLCIPPPGEEGSPGSPPQPEGAECTTATQAGQPGAEPGGSWAVLAEPAAADAAPLLAAAQQHLAHLAALQEQRQQLAEENAFLQRCARQYIDAGSKATKQSMADASAMAGIEQRYSLGLQQLQRLAAQRAAAEARAQAQLAPEQAKLAAAQACVEAHRQAFLGLISQVAEASRRSAPGSGRNPVSDKAVRVFLAAEPAKAAEVQALRLRNAELQHRIAALEQRLKDSDRLSDGLHLIDFEQLKIESSTLAYRIESRSGEVLKLRGRLVETIQMAAHAKEKLHCVEQEKRCQAERLQATQAQLQQRRLELAAAKARREQLQTARAELRRDWDVVTDRRCLADLKAQTAKLAELQGERSRLQQAYEALVASGGGRRLGAGKGGAVAGGA